MAKLIELEREEFLHEVTESWSKWEKSTTIKDLSQYMVDKAFTKKAMGTLTNLSKKQLREIILNGDEETVTDQAKKTPGGFGAELVDFLEEVKLAIHKNNIHPFIKKKAIQQVDKQLDKVDDSLLDKAGIVGLVTLGIFLLLELIFKDGFKDIPKKIQERREAKTLEAEIVENDKHE